MSIPFIEPTFISGRGKIQQHVLTGEMVFVLYTDMIHSTNPFQGPSCDRHCHGAAWMHRPYTLAPRSLYE